MTHFRDPEIGEVVLESMPGGLPLILGVIAVVVLVYAAYLFVDQRGSIVYEVPRSPARLVAPAVLVAAGVANYFLNGRGAEQVAVAAVLVAAAALALVARTGVGRAGIYADGIRRTWDRIDEVRVERAGSGVKVSWDVRGTTREMILPDANRSEVREFVREMRRSH